MDSKIELKNLLSEITRNEFPDEKETYQIFEDEINSSLLENKDAPLISESGAHNEFLGSAAEILSSVSVAFGTIKTFLEIKNMIKTKKEKIKNIDELWLKILLENKIEKSKAQKIVSKYKNDLTNIINS